MKYLLTLLILSVSLFASKPCQISKNIEIEDFGKNAYLTEYCYDKTVWVRYHDGYRGSFSQKLENVSFTNGISRPIKCTCKGYK